MKRCLIEESDARALLGELAPKKATSPSRYRCFSSIFHRFRRRAKGMDRWIDLASERDRREHADFFPIKGAAPRRAASYPIIDQARME